VQKYCVFLPAGSITLPVITGIIIICLNQTYLIQVRAKLLSNSRWYGFTCWDVMKAAVPRVHLGTFIIVVICTLHASGVAGGDAVVLPLVQTQDLVQSATSTGATVVHTRYEGKLPSLSGLLSADMTCHAHMATWLLSVAYETTRCSAVCTDNHTATLMPTKDCILCNQFPTRTPQKKEILVCCGSDANTWMFFLQRVTRQEIHTQSPM
jgi:hypothetical protein